MAGKLLMSCILQLDTRNPYVCPDARDEIWQPFELHLWPAAAPHSFIKTMI